jgi:XRE family aerobic/anaerobic benzoate catabolism transcriptional regulator
MLLHILGQRIRKQRKKRLLTQSDLAQKSGVSLRFVAQLESGKGNVSVQKLADICLVLDISLSNIFKGIGTGHAKILSLVGMKGAGKTTLGQMLSEKLNVHFIELDEEIVRTAEMSLSEVFAFGGEQFYHELESRALDGVLEQPNPCIIATGGSIVLHHENWQRLREYTTTVWLQTSPQNHLQRVLDQGDLRPIEGRINALMELRQILEQRSPFYSQARNTIDTDKNNINQTLEELVILYESSF